MSYINNKNTPSYVRPPRREPIRNSESKNPSFDPIPPLGEFMETNDDDDPQENYQFLVRKMLPVFQKNIKSMISVPEVTNELFSDDDEGDDNDDGGDDNDGDNVSEEENEQNSDDDTLGYSSDDSELNFDAPELELEDDLKYPKEGLDDTFSWIIIWILKYQERFRLPNVATNSLFKFFRYVLMNINKNLFSTFPTSLYMAHKNLGICAHLTKYAACEKCCKLYRIADVSSNSPDITPKFTDCVFQEFPNHPMSNKREICGNPLYKLVPTKNGIIKKPALIFPTVSLKHQLYLLFKRKGFEEACRKWVNRPSDPEILADIYDGRIWKSFKDENGLTFFQQDLADTNLGIMLNIDWFQPFENSQYSTGAIYAIICNLPRNERFKPSNILTLALIPGPNEPSLHRLNHYLAPLVDQLIELWHGIDLSETFEHSDGKTIKAAVICCSCDIPAARKLCGHISARIACYRCLKHANYDDRNQPNFGGLDDMNNLL